MWHDPIEIGQEGSFPCKQTKQALKMFLRSQFFFFKIYFQLMDYLYCIIFSWNSKLELFEMRKSLVCRNISYGLVVLNLLYMCASSYVLWDLKSTGKDLSIFSIALHLLGVVGSWYLLLLRSLYTTKAGELVCLMNSVILLENQHLQSKPTLNSRRNAHKDVRDPLNGL